MAKTKSTRVCGLPAKRPSGGKPRKVATEAVVTFTFDPAAPKVLSHRVDEIAPPIVTAWGRKAPDVKTTPVGMYDVTPGASGIESDNTERPPEPPPGLRGRLEAQAEKSGDPESETVEIWTVHDFDTGHTSNGHRRVGSRLKYAKMVNALAAAAEERSKTKAKRKGPRRRPDRLKSSPGRAPSVKVVTRR